MRRSGRQSIRRGQPQRSITPVLSATGTTPPAVTATELGFLGVQVTVTMTAGALGVATFSYQLGARALVSGVLTAASVALGSSGVTLLFPASTYAADNVYKGFV